MCPHIDYLTLFAERAPEFLPLIFAFFLMLRSLSVLYCLLTILAPKLHTIELLLHITCHVRLWHPVLSAIWTVLLAFTSPLHNAVITDQLFTDDTFSRLLDHHQAYTAAEMLVEWLLQAVLRFHLQHLILIHISRHDLRVYIVDIVWFHQQFQPILFIIRPFSLKETWHQPISHLHCK